MSEVGRFKIHESFDITRRGLVVLGEIISGEIAHADLLTFTIHETSCTLKITGIDYARKINTPNELIGLMFSYANEKEKDFYKTIKVSPQIALVSAV